MQRRTLLLNILAASLMLGCSSEKKQPAPTMPSEPALIRAHAPTLGPADAPVTIVEFFDPSCEACRAFYPLVKQILAKHPEHVRLVLRYVPFHSGSEEAVRILAAARMQGVYVEVLEAILEVQPQWHNDPQLKAAWQAAGTAGLDLKLAHEQAKDPAISQNLAVDVKDAAAYEVTRTPTFFVNGKPVEPFGSQRFYNLVLSELAKTKGANQN